MTDSSNIIADLNKLSVGIAGADDVSRKLFIDFCNSATLHINAVSLDVKLPIMNAFVGSFGKVSSKLASYTCDNGMVILQTSVAMLTSFATGEVVCSLHELAFFDMTARLFSLLCRLLETFRSLPKNPTNSLLVAKAYMLSGLPGYKLKIPDDIITIADNSADARSKLNGNQTSTKKESDRRPGSGNVKKVRTLCLDPLLMNLENMRLHGSSTKASIESEKSALVRRNTLNFLCLLLQNSTASSIATAWPVLLSANVTRPGAFDTHSCVLSTLLHDPSLLVRYMACSVVIELLDDSVKAFIAIAQESLPFGGLPSFSSLPMPASSFTSYSMQLASLLHETHRCLLTSAINANSGSEKCSQMAVHVLKAIQFLVRITPYHRLRPGLLTDVFKVSAALLRSKDVDVRVACLTVFGEILANNDAHSVLEMECLIRSSKPPAISCRTYSHSLSFDMASSSPTGSLSGTATPLTPGSAVGGFGFQPWLLRVAMDSAAANSVYSYPVKIESLQLLNALIKYYSGTIFFEAKQLPELFKFIYSAMYASDAVYTAHVCFVLETIGHKLDEAIAENKFPAPLINEIVLFWSDSLSNHIFRLLQQPLPMDGAERVNGCTLKAALLDALSSIGPSVFESLPANLRILCTTMPVDLTAAPDSAVYKSLRAAAIRCLGHVVGFRCMQKDPSFIQLCCSIALKHSATEPACQCAAAWLLRNAIGESGDLPLSFSNQKELLEEIVSVCTKLILRGPDKAKPHAMTVVWRILADFLISGLQENASNKTKSLFAFAVDEVISKVLLGSVKGPVKLQWNAADGVAVLLASDTVVSAINHISSSASGTMLSSIINACCYSMSQCPNFRTRTTVATALSQLALRNDESVGQRYAVQCLSAFLEAFSNARSNIKSPTEFKHVDAFVVSLWIGFFTWLSATSEQMLSSWLEQVSVERVEAIILDTKGCINQPIVSDPQQCSRFHLLADRLTALAVPFPAAKLFSEAVSACILGAQKKTDDLY